MMMVWAPPAALGFMAAAGESGTSLDWTNLLSSAGVAGVFATAFALGKIRSKSEVDDLREDRDEARSQSQALIGKFMDEIIPLMTQTNDSLSKSNEVLERALSNEAVERAIRRERGVG